MKQSSEAFAFDLEKPLFFLRRAGEKGAKRMERRQPPSGPPGTMPLAAHAEEVGSGKKKPKRPAKGKKKGGRRTGPGSKRLTKQMEANVERLHQPSQREYHVEPLSVDTLRPLVDLAYWSTFLEVRRDCAAAFATLSMNEANLMTLSRAGALGALLALISIGGGRNDTQVHRDAATALAHLVTLDDVKYRLIKAPDGLKNLFIMCESGSYTVRRAAARAILNLSVVPDAQLAIVHAGGLEHMWQMTETKDERTRRTAVRILRQLATHPDNKARMVNQDSLERLGEALSTSYDLAFRRELIEVVAELAELESNASMIVDGGLLRPILVHMDLSQLPLDMVLMCLKCLVLLSAIEENQEAMLRGGAVGAITRCVFEDLPVLISAKAGNSQRHRGGPGSPSSSNPRRPAAVGGGTGGVRGGAGGRGGSKGASKGVESEATGIAKDLLRYGLHVLLDLSHAPSNRDAIIEWGVVDHLTQDNLVYSPDKRIRRMVGKILLLLAENGGNSSPRHQDIAAKGGLKVLAVFLDCEDYELKMCALATLAHLAVAPDLKRAMCMGRILDTLAALTTVQDRSISASVARILAEVVEDPDNIPGVAKADCIPALVKMCSPHGTNATGRIDAVRALASISNDKRVNPQIVAAGGIGYLLSLSKNGSGLDKMFAKATLGNLADDTAALQIQMAFRGFRGRRGFRRRRFGKKR